MVVPSFNRAHILHLTLPTYLQPEVGELILVDDCSTDNTREVVGRLIEQYPRIKYLRNEENSKQCFSKNRGIEAAQFPFIYFGDDDSILAQGSIARLLDTHQRYGAHVVGAKSLYMTNEEQWADPEAFIRKFDVFTDDVERIVTLSPLRTDFSLSVREPVEVPFTHACMLADTATARAIMFDTAFKGNAYREETDFGIRVELSGRKLLYDSQAVQVNLPASMVRGGGSHTRSSREWYRSTIENNDYFLDKNYAAMQAKWNLSCTIEEMRRMFAREMAARWRQEHRWDLLRKLGLYEPLRRLKRSLRL